MAELLHWLPNDLTDEKDKDLVSLTSSRAFVVALLTDVNDHIAATQVNDVLLGVE